MKSPFIDTSFLPDAQRKAKELELKSKITMEWNALQDELKLKTIYIDCSFWDGLAKPPVSIPIVLNTKIEDLLAICRKWSHFKTIGNRELMLVVDDIILPLGVTFYEFVAGEITGKSGHVLFQVDGKNTARVMEQAWYRENRHIFPASKWSVFDPAVSYSTQSKYN